MSRSIDWPIFPALAAEIDRRIEEERADTTRPSDERMTGKNLAAKIGISDTTISFIRNGKQPTSAHLPRICAALGIDMWAYFPFDSGQRRLLSALEKLRNADVPTDEENDIIRATELAAAGLIAELAQRKKP